MSLDLSTINFSVNTKPLEAAAAAIGELVTNVGKLDKAAKTAAQTEATLTRAAKDQAKANLDNAKAQDVRLKSTITADKADQQAATAIEKKTKATERASVAIKKNADMLQLQNDTYDFILEGFSKGDAKVLAMAKATGQLSDQLKQVLTDIRQFSKNTFDQTETGLDRMVKSAKEASSAQGFLNNGLNLTSKQAKELSNDLDRLNIRLQHQGKSYQEITKEQAIYKQRFVEEANAVNRATSALAAVEKQRKDVVSATNYLTQAEAKMAAALNTSNVALDKAGTDSLVKYEAALRKSGISQDAATAKLATYKAQLTQVAGLEEKRRAQHLARALQPQFTDIAVSLYSGQAPLTVLLQQSGQMVDLFKLSGIEADNLGKVMREAFASMIPAIATVAKGLTSLVFESFMSAGSAVTSFVGNVTGITAAMEIAKRAIVSGGEANFKYIASLDKIGKTFSAVAATGIAAMIAGMILLALEYKKIIQAEAELTNALATSGGALGISKTEAIAAAEGMASLGVGTLKAVAAITEIAKAGNIGKESLELITKSAIDLEKTAGISIEETAKQFAKLQEEPAKALTEIAQKTGLVDKATLDYVYALEQQGDKTEAARVATLALASANAQVAAEVRDNWSPIEVLWNDIKSAIGSVKQEIYDLTTSNAVVGALRTVWEAVAVTVSEVWFTIKGVGKEIGGIGAQIAAVMQGDFSGAAEIGRQMKTDAASAAEEQKKYVAAILNRTNVEQKSFNQSKEQDSQYAKWRKENDQALDKSISKTDKYKAKELEMQKAVLAGTVSQIEADKALAGWKKIILGEEKTKKDPSENYYATLMREATNNTIAANTAAQELTKSEQKLLEVRSDPRFEKLTATQKQDVISKYEAAIAAEKQTALTEKLAEAEEHRLKLLGKSEGIGKQYYSDMQKLEEFAKVAGWSRGEVEELTRAIFMATPAWKAYEKALEEVNSAARKFNEDSIASQADTIKENESLDYRLSLLGKTAEEQKALSIEYNRANKLREVDIKLAKQLRDIEEKIAKAKKDGLPESDYQSLIDAQVQARKDAAEQEKVINREVAVQYAEDLQKEFDAIKNGISDSIVTALFEGGKAGSKKIRDLVMAELRKPVTMVVNAVVNTVLGNTIGSLMGGTGAGGAGSLLSTAGGIGNLLGGLGSFGSTVAGGIGSVVGSVFGVGAGNVALGTSLGLGASSSTAAALAAAQAGGAAGGAGAAGMGSFLSGAGAAMPYIGAAIALISLISGMDDSGTYHTGGAASYSAATGQRNSLGFRDNEEGLPSYNPRNNIDNQFGTGFGYVERGDQTISAMEQLSKSLVEIFDGIAKTFGKTAGYEVAVAFADDTSEDGAWGAFAVRLQGVEILNWDDFRQSKWAPKEFGDGEEGYKQYLATIAKDTRQVLLDMDLPSWADQVLTAIGETPSIEALSGAIQLLAQVETVFKSFGQYMPQFAILTDSAKEALIRASGGVQALTGNMSSFVNAFYTDAEKLAISSNNLSEELSKLGFEMPKTREEFKALVQSQIELGDSGAESLAALLSLSGAMDAVLPAFNDVTDAVSGLSEVMKGLNEETASLEIELLRAKGDTAGANAAQRTLDTQGFTEAEIAIYDYNQSIRDQIKVLTEASAETEKQTSTRLGLERQLLQLQGDTEALRLLDIAGMDEYNVKLYDQIQSLTAASTAAATLASNMKNLRAGLISLEGRFTGGGFSKQYKAEDAAKEINSLLASVGINKDVATITSALLNSTTDEVESYFREIWEVLDTDEARLRLVEVSNAMLDIAVASETAAEKFQKQTDAFSKLASDVADLFAARNSAGNLLDKIAGAMGNQGSFAAQREGELWSALYSTTDLKKQVDLAEQLTDIVISRQQLEVQNAEKLMEFGKGLKSYVDSLKLGALSPLTNAQKLAEASKQYSETLTKAIGGDANAQSNLQGISSSFLEIARTYYAGNEDFVNIFNSVTSSLESLGVNSMSEAQQQIAVGNQSLAELQKLYTITESAYSSLNSQYESALSSLVIAQDSLVLQAKSFEQLVAIYDSLASLPSEISARLPNLDVSTPNLVTNTQNGVTVDNTALIEEVKALRLEVARLAAENREDAAKVAAATIMASQANAATITDATTKAARTTEVKQGATIQ